MEKFQITINLGNDAFKENENSEIARILKTVVSLLLMDNEPLTFYPLFDVNGNKIGSVKQN
jgi:hypothetical protein